VRIKLQCKNANPRLSPIPVQIDTCAITVDNAFSEIMRARPRRESGRAAVPVPKCEPVHCFTLDCKGKLVHIGMALRLKRRLA
jgi:hypothetical protein